MKDETKLNQLLMAVQTVAPLMTAGEFDGMLSAMKTIASSKNVQTMIERSIEILTEDETAWAKRVKKEFAPILKEAEGIESQAKEWAIGKFRAGETDKSVPSEFGDLTFTERQTVEIVDVARIPKKYFVKPDTAEILKDLKAGLKVPGAKLETTVGASFKGAKE